jgi:glycosyltransferase involved in cell wall biosynthesis
MNILQVIRYFVPAWGYGGPLSACYSLSKELVNRNHEVSVFTTDALDARNRIKKTEEVVDGIKVWRFRNLSNRLAYEHNMSVSPGMLPALRKNGGSFDLMHMHEYRTVQNIMAHHYAVKYGIPYVLQAHGSLPRIMAKQMLKRAYDVLWGSILLRDAARVIATTRFEAEQYQSMGVSEEKIEIVPNGIIWSEFESLPPKGEFKQHYGLGNDERLILYLGRIHKIKGLDLLLKAFASYAAHRRDTNLVIVGPDDGYLPELRRLVKELEAEPSVIITGPLYGRDKLTAYVDADVYVLPSQYEIFGITVLEAAACGTPVIVTDRCGIAELINGQVGLVVSYDEGQLKNAIIRMFDDDNMRRDFGEKGKLLVRERFNWEKIARQMEKIYAGIL